MMAVLPNTLGHNQRSVRVEFSEYFHAHFLRIDEPVLLRLVKTVRSLNRPAFCFERLGEDIFHFGLFRPEWKMSSPRRSKQKAGRFNERTVLTRRSSTGSSIRRKWAWKYSENSTRTLL